MANVPSVSATSLGYQRVVSSSHLINLFMKQTATLKLDIDVPFAGSPASMQDLQKQEISQSSVSVVTFASNN